MKNDAPAVVRDSAKYIETTCTEYSGGTIALKRDDAYVAYFEVTWKKCTYDEKGVEEIKTCSWPDNGKHRTSDFSTDISPGGSCFDIHVRHGSSQTLPGRKTQSH